MKEKYTNHNGSLESSQYITLNITVLFKDKPDFPKSGSKPIQVQCIFTTCFMSPWLFQSATFPERKHVNRTISQPKCATCVRRHKITDYGKPITPLHLRNFTSGWSWINIAYIKYIKMGIWIQMCPSLCQFASCQIWYSRSVPFNKPRIWQLLPNLSWL